MPVKTHKTTKTTKGNTWLPAIAAIAFFSVAFAGAAQSMSSASPGYTLSEVSAHNSASDCWLIINGKVYNVTTYIPYHPGGPAAITAYCGGDAAAAFAGHSNNAETLLASYYVGDVVSNPPPVQDATPPTVAISAPANITYPIAALSLNYTAADTGSGVNASACTYKLDAGAITPLPDCKSTALPALADGAHTITVYSKDNTGNQGSASVSFSVDTVAPSVAIQSPANATYNTSAVALKFAAADSGSGVASCSYRLDAGILSSLPGCANTTLSALTNGAHTATVYSKDKAGNTGNASVSFTVNATVPPAPVPPPLNIPPPTIPPNMTHPPETHPPGFVNRTRPHHDDDDDENEDNEKEGGNRSNKSASRDGNKKDSFEKRWHGKWNAHRLLQSLRMYRDSALPHFKE